MDEKINSSQELERHLSIEEIYEEISSIEPKPIEAFVPLNGDEQKQLFMNGSIKNPKHVYDRLEKLNSEADSAKIKELASLLPDALAVESIDYIAYSEYANRFAMIHELLQSARDIHSPDEEIAHKAEVRFMELNKELYGEPDENTYRSLVSEAIRGVNTKELSEGMLGIKSDLDNYYQPLTSRLIGLFLPMKQLQICKISQSIYMVECLSIFQKNKRALPRMK